jgi:hypothetical protein
MVSARAGLAPRAVKPNATASTYLVIFMSHLSHLVIGGLKKKSRCIGAQQLLCHF